MVDDLMLEWVQQQLTNLSRIQLAGKMSGMYRIMNIIDVQSTQVLVML